jgi:hypothetical protein
MFLDIAGHRRSCSGQGVGARDSRSLTLVDNRLHNGAVPRSLICTVCCQRCRSGASAICRACLHPKDLHRETCAHRGCALPAEWPMAHCREHARFVLEERPIVAVLNERDRIKVPCPHCGEPLRPLEWGIDLGRAEAWVRTPCESCSLAPGDAPPEKFFGMMRFTMRRETCEPGFLLSQKCTCGHDVLQDHFGFARVDIWGWPIGPWCSQCIAAAPRSPHEDMYIDCPDIFPRPTRCVLQPKYEIPVEVLLSDAGLQ